MTSPADEIAAAAPADVVMSFLTGMADGDADAVLALIADDIVYENVSLPTIRGKAAMTRGIHTYYHRGLGFEVQVHRITTDGTTVLTERTDAITWGRFRSQFWVCGVFEVQDGQVHLWRDYFDWGNVTAASLRGLIAMVVPSLQARLPGPQPA